MSGWSKDRIALYIACPRRARQGINPTYLSRKAIFLIFLLLLLGNSSALKLTIRRGSGGSASADGGQYRPRRALTGQLRTNTMLLWRPRSGLSGRRPNWKRQPELRRCVVLMFARFVPSLTKDVSRAPILLLQCFRAHSPASSHRAYPHRDANPIFNCGEPAGALRWRRRRPVTSRGDCSV